MKTLQSFIVAGVLLSSGPAWSINKCTGPDGKAVFQDRPCAGAGEKITVRPASGHDPASVPVTSGAKPMTEAERLNASTAASQRERRRRELETIHVPNAASYIDRQRGLCDAELRALQARKLSAANNLAGATWESSISTEMTAIATRCDSRNRDLRDDLETMRKECRDLGGCA
jgi:hypothetical protein